MQGLLTAFGRGFKKWIGWKRLGIAASLLIITLAVRTLVHTLRGVDTGVILTALTDIPPGHIALAALCVICAFCTLTFYDFFALRTIGKKAVPYRIAALSSFTSYSIGHNLGATVFTGGAIRFRIYSDYGLTAIDVAKICFLSGLTFWLGNLVVLGVGMAYHPAAASEMDLLPAELNRLIALGCLAGIAAYFVWLVTGKERRQLGQNGWKVVLPSAKLTLVQILIGVVDLGFCAMAMYLLVPAQPHIDFMSLAVVFILATLLGFASHAPGQPWRVRRRHAGGAAAIRKRAAARDAAGVSRALFLHSLQHRDLDHGNARDLAQRGGALEAPPRERQLLAFHHRAPAGGHHDASARHRGGAAVQALSVERLRPRGTVTLCWRKADTLISAPTVTSKARHDPVLPSFVHDRRPAVGRGARAAGIRANCA